MLKIANFRLRLYRVVFWDPSILKKMGIKWTGGFLDLQAPIGHTNPQLELTRLTVTAHPVLKINLKIS